MTGATTTAGPLSLGNLSLSTNVVLYRPLNGFRRTPYNCVPGCAAFAGSLITAMDNKILLLFVTVLIIGLQIADGCDMDQTRHGCRIQSRVCSCGFGCKSEYRYLTMKDCQDALKGKRTDVCFNQPCMNGGSCIQISQFPGYRCRCEGTGYYGQRCHISCPLPGTHVRGAFPYECIVI